MSPTSACRRLVHSSSTSSPEISVFQASSTGKRGQPARDGPSPTLPLPAFAEPALPPVAPEPVLPPVALDPPDSEPALPPVAGALPPEPFPLPPLPPPPPAD